VFENYARYKELGGNNYIDAIMRNIADLYTIHHGFEPPHYIHKDEK
jgi:hypothetical protein